MRVISIGFYDDDTRFFLSLKSELKKKGNNLRFIHLNIHLSGFLYTLFKNVNSIFFPLKAWINILLNYRKYKSIVLNQNSYKGVEFSKVNRYSLSLDPNPERNKLYINLQAISYIDLLAGLFSKFQPDYLLLSGDSRLLIEVADAIGKQMHIKTYYFEQGPFGTTIFDPKGVNAYASIRDIQIHANSNEDEKKLEKIKLFFERKRPSKFKRNPIYRGSDYIFEFLFTKLFIVPIDIRRPKKIDSSNTIYNKVLESNKTKNLVVNKKVFLLVLQVPNDVNMVYHSPNFLNHYEVVRGVFNALPEDSNLIVREHPLFKAKYEKQLYQLIIDNENVLIDNGEKLPIAIQNADVVIVNNSTVGIEAIAKYKPTVVLGECYYDNDKICLKYRNNNLNSILKQSLEFEPNKSAIIDYLYQFTHLYLFDGHFRDSQLEQCSSSICKLVI